MAENKTKNLVSKPPLQALMVDQNGLISRAWAIFFRDLYRRTAYKGGNSIDESIQDIDDLVTAVEVNIIAIANNASAISSNASDINQNSLDIIQNASDIAVNVLAIAQNASDITASEGDITTLTSSLNAHTGASSAHGSNGDVVGFGDLANATTVGLVKRMAVISDAIDTTVNITTADLAAAPATYDQTYTQTAADLTNENKAAINQLASDLSDAIAVLNDLLAKSKTSGQMAT